MQLPFKRFLYFFNKKKQQESNLDNFEFAMELQRRYGINVKIPAYNYGRRFRKQNLYIPSLAKEILPPEDYEKFIQEYKKVVEQTEKEYEEMREIMQHREGFSFVAIDEMEK